MSKKEPEIVEKELWDHYSELPNPAWYDYKNKEELRLEKNNQNVKLIKIINMKADLVKIVEDVWLEGGLDNGIYEVAALTCLQRLEELTNQRVIEELERIKGLGVTYTDDVIDKRIKELKQ